MEARLGWLRVCNVRTHALTKGLRPFFNQKRAPPKFGGMNDLLRVYNNLTPVLVPVLLVRLVFLVFVFIFALVVLIALVVLVALVVLLVLVVLVVLLLPLTPRVTDSGVWSLRALNP